jgi:hypothetical protein
MLHQRRGQTQRTEDGNAKHLDHHLQSRVTYHHGLQTPMYSSANASPEEGTASEDGGWQCKYLKHHLQSRVTIIWVSDVCVFEGQCFARGGDSLRGRRMARVQAKGPKE